MSRKNDFISKVSPPLRFFERTGFRLIECPNSSLFGKFPIQLLFFELIVAVIDDSMQSYFCDLLKEYSNKMFF